MDLKTKRFIIWSLVASTISFLGFSFLYLELNPAKWTFNVRGMFIVFFFMGVYLGFGIAQYAYNYNKK